VVRWTGSPPRTLGWAERCGIRQTPTLESEESAQTLDSPLASRSLSWLVEYLPRFWSRRDRFRPGSRV
jgi:hypothetical protein